MTAKHYRALPYLPAAVDIETREDGVLVLTCPYAPGVMPRSGAHDLLAAAERHPHQTLIAELNDEGEWQHLDYASAVAGCRRVAQWLLDQGASATRPLAILSGNSINHFLMAWGAIFARVPYVPVSLSYSTISGALPKLEAVLAAVDPAFVFAERVADHAAALDAVALDPAQVTVISTDLAGRRGVDWADVIATTATRSVQNSIDAIDHDTVTRYMFTSGSTGMPKGVIHTHGMSCAMLAANAGLRRRVEEAGGRVLEWMPWSHVGAGVMRMAMVINAGGALYLDTGKPVPGEFGKTVTNLRSAKPTSYSGAPLGWSMIVDALEADEDLAALFFSHVTSMGFGSAAMPEALARRLDALTERYAPERLHLTTSLASTEVSTGLQRYFPSTDLASLGLPQPGVEVKLVPFGSKYELRVRGPGITRGYLRSPDKTEAAFDDEGFFCMGDALAFVDPREPLRGLRFAGRVAEEFKLQSGTWVSAGTLRADVVTAGSPYLRDVVICGLNQSSVAVMAWPNLPACAVHAGSDDPEVICRSGAVRKAIAGGLQNFNRDNPGSSRRIARFLLLAEPPDPGRFEVTDKGYVNQGEVQSRRRDDVDRLYADPPDDSVTVLPVVRS